MAKATAKRLDYVVVESETRSWGNRSMNIDPIVSKRFTLCRVREATDDGRIIKVDEVRQYGKTVSGGPVGTHVNRFVIGDWFKPRHARAIRGNMYGQPEWATYEDAREAVFDAKGRA